MANSKGVSSNADQQKMAALERKVVELESKTRAYPPPQRVIKSADKSKTNKGETTCSLAAASQKGAGKGKAGRGKCTEGKTDKGKGNKGVIGTGLRFDDLMATPRATERFSQPESELTSGFCYAFQNRKCNNVCMPQDSCLRVGCNTANVPYVDCFCLETA